MKVLRVGQKFRVPKAAILEALGVTTAAPTGHRPRPAAGSAALTWPWLPLPGCETPRRFRPRGLEVQHERHPRGRGADGTLG